MLLSLKIENYALIKECNISFPSGFVSITGETGAGKSILLGALSLVLGQRADVSTLMDKERKCIVEAVFEINESLKPLFEENDVDFDTQSYFRREILPSGKSRAFVNDTPVQLPLLREFADRLRDIHSQSTTTKLKDSSFQLSLLDSMSGDRNCLISYKNTFKDYKQILKEIEDLEKSKSENIKEQSYNEFLFNELENAKLQSSEEEDLEKERTLLSNAEQIKDCIFTSLNLFDNNAENNILSDLNTAKHQISKIKEHSSDLAEIYQRLESSLIEIKDIFSELSSYNDNLVFDNERLDYCNERLDLIYSLQRKHNVDTVEELIKIKEQLSEKLYFADNISSVLEEKNKEKDLLTEQLNSLSELLHKQRQLSAEKIERNVLPLLSSMAMKDAVLKVEISSTQDFTPTGKDTVRFLFSANKTKDNSLSEIGKVISGGELSRLMLAIKAVAAESFSVPTLVFDEIDTGISGDIASKVGEIMRSIGLNHQVITITHLVQVSVKASSQFKVYKQTDEGQTVSNISLLSDKERITETALMLSDGNITKEAVANAKQLLQ
ncbi:MAG: DNA repair protein RecN [Bacteroidales bacterium]|nr:DNA repair protein RecN [Bacteroidales bacterium]